jgi:signal transduction histidine kinase
MGSLQRKLDGGLLHASSLYQVMLRVFNRSPKGVAVVKDRRIVATNPRFDEMDRRGRAGNDWHGGTEGSTAGDRFSSLREIAVWHAFVADMDGVPRRPLRFRRGDMVVECLFDVAPGSDGVVLAIVNDVTALAQAEEELSAIRARVVQQEPLRVLGEVAAGVGHDLSNVLAALNLRVRVLMDQEQARGGVSDNLEAIGRMSQQASSLASRMQALARPAAGQLASVDLRDVVEAAIAVAGTRLRVQGSGGNLRLVPARIDVQLDGLPAVRGDAGDLQRVFINLLINARDAMPDGGTISVRGRVTAGQVVATVEDEGSGIRAEHLPRLFEMRFTTKGDGGSGIGLAVVKRVMEAHGGSVSARNRRGRGACFELRFPVPAPAPGIGSARPSA